MSIEPGPRIAARSRNVGQRLSGLIFDLGCQPHDKIPVEHSAALDALERFRLWAGNMGAMRWPASKLSLDQRLSEAPEVQNLVCQLLDDLREAVDDLSSIVKGSDENREGACDIAFDSEGNAQVIPSNDEDKFEKPADEANMILDIISECITSLFRTGILIRKAGTTDRFKRALQMSTATFDPEFDIDYVREKHPKLKDPVHITSGLPERLGSAMSKRRQFIKYSRDHRARLGYEGPIEPLEDRPARTEQLSSKATSLHPEEVRALSLLPTAFDDEEEEDVVSVMSASTLTSSASTLILPRLEDLSPNGVPFECPICLTLQSFRTQKAWRIHVFRDLKPYVCTIGGKDCESELFGDRNSWFEHEIQRHRAQYTCILCASGPFTTQSDVESHISGTHGSFGPDQLQKLRDAGRQTLTQLRARDCPFCNDWAEKLRDAADLKGKRPVWGGADHDVLVGATRFKRHVAVHQEQLALFAIPRAVEESGTPRPGSAGSLSAVMSLRSVESEENADSAPRSPGGVQDRHDVNVSGYGKPLNPSENLSVGFPVVGGVSGGQSGPAPLGAANPEARTTALDKEPFPGGPRKQRLWKSRLSRLASRVADSLKALSGSLAKRRTLNVWGRGRRAGASVEKGTTAGTRGDDSKTPSSPKPGDGDRHSYLNTVTGPDLFLTPQGRPDSALSAYTERPRPSRSFSDKSPVVTATSPGRAEPDSHADSVSPPWVGNSSDPKPPPGVYASTFKKDTVVRAPKNPVFQFGGSSDSPFTTFSVAFPNPAKPGEHFNQSRERPFVCVFAFAGCTSTFHHKDEWKRHALSQHIVPKYWLCKEQQCVRANRGIGGPTFHHTDLYTQHVRRIHVPMKYREDVDRGVQVPEWDRALRAMQDSAERRRCEMPTYMKCPDPLCSDSFTGPSAWDERMEHVAEHIQQGRELARQGSLGGGGTSDWPLADWARRPDVNIVKQVGDEWKLVSPTWFPTDRPAPYLPPHSDRDEEFARLFRLGYSISDGRHNWNSQGIGGGGFLAGNAERADAGLGSPPAEVGEGEGCDTYMEPAA